MPPADPFWNLSFSAWLKARPGSVSPTRLPRARLGCKIVSLASLELRVEAVQEQLAAVDPEGTTASLRARSRQLCAAVAQCRKSEFSPELKGLLEMKVQAIEDELALLAGQSVRGTSAFFR
jgi:hypothetical protein